MEVSKLSSSAPMPQALGKGRGPGKRLWALLWGTLGPGTSGQTWRSSALHGGGPVKPAVLMTFLKGQPPLCNPEGLAQTRAPPGTGGNEAALTLGVLGACLGLHLLVWMDL